jgi:hypothetical protein
MLPLSVQQHELLTELCRRRSIPLTELDGRRLRPLLSRNLAVTSWGEVRPTPAGVEASKVLPSGPDQASLTAAAGRLSETQETLLRYLFQQEGPVPVDHLDGRSLRALERRGLISVRGGWTTPNPSARTHFDTHVNQQQRIRQRRIHSGRASARAGAVLRAVDELERVIPRGSELLVAGVPAYADDILEGLRRLAREMESRGVHQVVEWRTARA